MENTAKEERCICPYCDEEISITSSRLCQACGVLFKHCVKCQITVLAKEVTTCPKCGDPLS